MAQNSSRFFFALACTTVPSARTTSAATTLSSASPYFLTFQPMPPVKVSPPTPTLLVSPEEIARPCGANAARNLSPGGAAADPHQVLFFVDDLHIREIAEVDDDAAVVGGEARKAMAAASHGQHKP